MRQILKALFSGQTLTRQEAHRAMNIIMNDEAKPEQIGALLGILHGRGETIEELIGFVSAMREHAIQFDDINRGDMIDTCGTGGDELNTFNISTTVALLLSACGLTVVKHGNRSVSSRCGSADVLEALGINITLSPQQITQQINALGFGFFFARSFHPAMSNIAPVRTSLGVKTVFNLLGPLTNPAGAKRQLLGVYDATLLERLAHVLGEMGSEEAMLVTSAEGLDEISLSSETYVAHLKNGRVTSYTIHPQDAGLTPAPLRELMGGDASYNATIIENIFAGERSPRRDVVLLNAAAALLVAGKASDLTHGVTLAAQAIDSRKAADLLTNLRNFR